MKAINNPTKLWRIARNAVLLTLMALLSLNIVPVQAIPPGALAPGTTFENASALGLTGPYNSIPCSITQSVDPTTCLNGVRLETNSRDGYMFNFYLENPSYVAFTFYTQQPLDTIAKYESGFQVLRLYDSKRAAQITGRLPDCTPSYCTSTLEIAKLPAGAYFLKVDFYRYHRYDSSSHSGWLTWSVSPPQIGYTTTPTPTPLAGSSAFYALPWYNQEDIYGQFERKYGNTASHWYKVNLIADQRYSLRLWGSANTDLNVYVYSETSISRPIASGVARTYPEYVMISVPSGVRFVYIEVKNSSYGNSAEYSMLLTR